MDQPHLREQFQDCLDSAQMYTGCAARRKSFHLMGGQGWPVPGGWLDGVYGFPGDPTSLKD